MNKVALVKCELSSKLQCNLTGELNMSKGMGRGNNKQIKVCFVLLKLQLRMNSVEKLSGMGKVMTSLSVALLFTH